MSDRGMPFYGVPKTANFAATSGSNAGVERRFFAPVKEMGVHYKRIPPGILFIPHPSFDFVEIHLPLWEGYSWNPSAIASRCHLSLDKGGFL